MLQECKRTVLVGGFVSLKILCLILNLNQPAMGQRSCQFKPLLYSKPPLKNSNPHPTSELKTAPTSEKRLALIEKVRVHVVGIINPTFSFNLLFRIFSYDLFHDVVDKMGVTTYCIHYAWSGATLLKS